MFSAVVSRLEKSALCNAPTSHCSLRRVPIRGGPAKEINRHVGRVLFAAAQSRRRVSCAVQSDVTENASYETTLLPSKELSSSFESTFKANESSEVSEQEIKPEPEMNEESVAMTPEMDISEPAVSAEDSAKGFKDFKPGDEVTIQVRPSRHPLGVYVDLINYPPEKAFLPYQHFAHNIFSSAPQPLSLELPEERVEANAIRKAVVTQVVKNMSRESGGRYIVSGKDFDEKIIFRRLAQIRDLCNAGETIRGYVMSRNKGGLIVRVAGYSCFLPRSYLTKESERMCSVEEKVFDAKFRHSELDVCVRDVQRSHLRVIVSHRMAESMRILGDLKIGSLVHGRVREGARYGVFVGIYGTERMALLHARNISQRVVRHPEEVFKEGDEVYAIVADMDADRRRISLSTADLEEESGEILYNKERVMKNAPIMAARLQKELELAREQYASETHEAPPLEQDQ